MFHLIVGYAEDSWGSSPGTMSTQRFLEYTDDDIASRYSSLDQKLLDELLEYPVIFMCEGESSPSFIGTLTHLEESGGSLVFEFERIQGIPDIPTGLLDEYERSLGIHSFEFHRTHWAIKEPSLPDVLTEAGFFNPELTEVMNAALGNALPEPSPVTSSSSSSPYNEEQVFIVHGHDEIAKIEARDYVRTHGKEPIILHMQASGGRTIIEKIDHYSNVGFALVLYTECDVGAKRDTLVYKRRARQNVVFEHGYLIGKIGRPRVVALVKGDVETPNDISGVVYIPMDAEGAWKSEVDREMRSCGYL